MKNDQIEKEFENDEKIQEYENEIDLLRKEMKDKDNII